MLELRPNCENCNADLPPDSTEARICSYECTFCVTCVDEVLHDVCPNCGGGFAPRPQRVTRAWRDGVSLAHQPASTTRKHNPLVDGGHAAFAEQIREIPPTRR